MKKMNKLVVAVALACGTLAAAPVSAQVSFAVSTPGLSIGVNVPAYPQLVPVPGYPVYYAPQLNSNYFFYDGLYWVYSNDNWYASSWYNGPWSLVEPDVVPVFLLRVPVRYYRRPPTYHDDRLRNAPIGHFVDVIANGFGAMPDYSDQVGARDRWAIAAYIRALQLSQHAQLADVPERERGALR